MVDGSNRLIGVVTDRDIVCRIVAKGKDPSSCSAQDAMTQPVVAVLADTTLDEVVAVMEENQIRRVPVVDAAGCCCGIISQADVAMVAKESEVGEMVREVRATRRFTNRDGLARPLSRRSSRTPHWWWHSPPPA